MDNNDGGNDPVAQVVAGLRQALRDLWSGRTSVSRGARAIGGTGHQNANVDATSEDAVGLILDCTNSISLLNMRIEDDVRVMQELPQEGDFTAHLNLIDSYAASIHGYLVFNLEAHIDHDGYRDIQDGLALINISLHIFHEVLAYCYGNVAPADGMAPPVVGHGGLGGGGVAGVVNVVFREAMVAIIGAREVIEQGNQSITQGVIIINAQPVPHKILGAIESIAPCLAAITWASTYVGDTIGQIIANFQQGAVNPDAALLTAIVQMHTSINATVVALHSAVLAFAAAPVSDWAQSKLHMGLFHYHLALRQIQDALRQIWAAN